MGTIKSLLTRMQAVDSNKIITEVMKDAESELGDLNARQINTGVREDGSNMPDYSRVSVDFYGKPEGPIRLRETGDFQEGLFARIVGDNVLFGSTDNKADELETQYGEKIFGLSEKYKDEARREKIEPDFKDKIQAVTGLKFN